MEYNMQENPKLNHYAMHLKLTQCCTLTILQLKKKKEVVLEACIGFRTLSRAKNIPGD